MAQSSDTPGSAPDPGSPIGVLVVDDAARRRFTISQGLNEAGGMVVVGTTRAGKDALEKIPRPQPDVVPLDTCFGMVKITGRHQPWRDGANPHAVAPGGELTVEA